MLENSVIAFFASLWRCNPINILLMCLWATYTTNTLSQIPFENSFQSISFLIGLKIAIFFLVQNHYYREDSYQESTSWKMERTRAFSVN